MLVDALQIALIVVQVVFVCITALVCVTVVVGSISLGLGVPFVRTPSRAYPLISNALRIENGDKVYELGSGDGGLTLALGKLFPHARFVGIERNPILYAYANMRKRLHGNTQNVTFRRENFFKTDLRDASKIYAYLLNSVMDALLPKLEQELKGVRVASRAFQFKQRTHTEAIELSKRKGSHGQHMLYVYEF
ncbi:MAG TPA: class I SAM-dependent methyltransferase [Candidatus Paceibacterota bacterium]